MPATLLRSCPGPMLLWIIAVLTVFSVGGPGSDRRAGETRDWTGLVPRLDVTACDEEHPAPEHALFRKPADPVPLPPADLPAVVPPAPRCRLSDRGVEWPGGGTAAVVGSGGCRAPPALG